VDTYIKFSDGYTKLGLSSLESSDEKVIKEIISSISSAEGGCKIHFKKIDDKAYSSLTSVFDNVEPYGKGPGISSGCELDKRKGGQALIQGDQG
jgi:hypothetical protein